MSPPCYTRFFFCGISLFRIYLCMYNYTYMRMPCATELYGRPWIFDLEFVRHGFVSNRCIGVAVLVGECMQGP